MKHLLIVEDDTSLRELLRTGLSTDSLRIHEAGSLQEARVKIAAHPIDLALVDGDLPDGLGVDLIQELRQQGWDNPIVFMTGLFRDLATFHQLTKDLQVHRVAYKPVDVAAFRKDVAAVLGQLKRKDSRPPLQRKVSREAQDALRLLREGFSARLPEKLAELQDAVDRVSSDPSATDQARVMAHRLRGSAGSYGYPEVGIAVGRVEDLLRGILDDGCITTDVLTALGDAMHGVHSTATQPAPRASTPAASSQGALLVVDNDPSFVQLVRQVATDLRVPLLVAADVEAAAKLAESHRLEAAMLDVQLAAGTEQAFALARRIHETVHNTEAEIAFTSSDGQLATRLAAVEAGGHRFIEKPISRERLSQALQRVIEQAGQRRGRVLIVESDEDTRCEYAGLLRQRGFAVDVLESADRLVQTLEELAPDLVLLDVELPRISGIDVCRALRASEHWQLLPVLMLTGNTDTETRLRAFTAGANDVIIRPVIEQELWARVGVQLDRIRLVRERADRDHLSGLPMRRAFYDAFERAMAQCRRRQLPMSIALLDLDNFKSLNDRHGHLVGDRVIAKVGELLRRHYRLEDLVARWGGEEFVLAFAGEREEVALNAMQRLRDELAGESFMGADGLPFQVTFSAGTASSPEDGGSLTELIRSADRRLYQAKGTGRDRVEGSDRCEVLSAGGNG